jgi:soluble lytic murein transglycosylase-like protein
MGGGQERFDTGPITRYSLIMTLAALTLYFSTMAGIYNLPEGLLDSVCLIESNYNAQAINVDDGNSSSIGICQIKVSTARIFGFRGSERDLENPGTNIRYAARYLSYQLHRYSGDIPRAVSAYNAGTCRLNKNGLILNRNYVNKVMKVWATKIRRDPKHEVTQVKRLSKIHKRQ